MEVREGMTSVVLTVGPGHTLREAAKLMTDKGIGAAVVIDDAAPGPGIISERDILNAVGRDQDPDTERVAEHMRDTVITASPAWSLERAAAEMSKRGIRHLVIVEGGHPFGGLWRRDTMRGWASGGATWGMTPPEQEAVG